jgi:hypothetical protein
MKWTRVSPPLCFPPPPRTQTLIYVRAHTHAPSRTPPPPSLQVDMPEDPVLKEFELQRAAMAELELIPPSPRLDSPRKGGMASEVRGGICTDSLSRGCVVCGGGRSPLAQILTPFTCHLA